MAHNKPLDDRAPLGYLAPRINQGVKDMFKLLTRYLDKPTLANAQKIRAYDWSHPMASCMLTPEESAHVANAIHHANSGKLNPAAE